MDAKQQRILDAASDFWISSEILWSQSGQQIFPLRSTIVTTAFAIELYLKFLSSIYGVDAWGHGLLSLFQKLPKQLKVEIRLNYKGKGTVEEALEEYKNLFVDWRYIFQKQDSCFSLDIQSLVALRDCVRIVSETYR